MMAPKNFFDIDSERVEHFHNLKIKLLTKSQLYNTVLRSC